MQIHWPMIFNYANELTNDFYYANELTNDFIIKMHYKGFLQWKRIANDFYYENVLTNDFYYENALVNDFIMIMHWPMIFFKCTDQWSLLWKMHNKWFYYYFYNAYRLGQNLLLYKCIDKWFFLWKCTGQ